MNMRSICSFKIDKIVELNLYVSDALCFNIVNYYFFLIGRRI